MNRVRKICEKVHQTHLERRIPDQGIQTSKKPTKFQLRTTPTINTSIRLGYSALAEEGVSSPRGYADEEGLDSLATK